jgi:flagellar protein FliO/FliZ
MAGKRYNILVLFLFLAVILVLFSSDAFYAADLDRLNQELDKQQQQAQPLTQDNLWGELVKLAFFLALIVGAAWSLVRLFGNKANQRMQGNWIRIVDEVIIGQNRAILLCQVEDRLYAVGVTEHNISLLFEVDATRIRDEIEEGPYINPGAEKVRDAASWIQSFTGKLTNKRVKSIVRPMDFHSLMEEQAKRLQNLDNTFPDYNQNESKNE